MIGDAGDDVAVDLALTLLMSTRPAVQRQLAGIDERVGEIEIDVVAVQASRQPRRIGVPVEDVESRRLRCRADNC